MKTCHILGHDGFDLDVLYNVISFYRSLGLRVVFSRRLAPADLLVILRPRNDVLDLRGYGAVHIWDYVGESSKAVAILMRTASDKSIVLASSHARASELTAGYPDLHARVKVLLPPVDVSLWSGNACEKRESRFVHVGHYKSFYDNDGASDVYAERFLWLMRHVRADIWGAGWNDVVGMKPHGPINLFSVSSKYALARFAFGMMYPHQRARTLSGRFWHGPLNGCLLLSEPSTYAGVIPGVIETTYEPHDIERAIKDDGSAPEDVRRRAETFWREQFRRAQDELSGHVGHGNMARARSAAMLVYGSVDNAGRRLWHRMK